jgi:hypothetical protein
MVTATQRRIACQSAEDHHRRAAQAERENVHILVDHRTGQHVATSASDASRCYHVSIEACACRGFQSWNRCKHHSLLLSELGWIQPDPEPTPPAAPVTPCGECGGLGELQDLEVRQHGRFTMLWATCPVCNGSGKRSPATVASDGPLTGLVRAGWASDHDARIVRDREVA